MHGRFRRHSTVAGLVVWVPVEAQLEDGILAGVGSEGYTGATGLRGVAGDSSGAGLAKGMYWEGYRVGTKEL